MPSQYSFFAGVVEDGMTPHRIPTDRDVQNQLIEMFSEQALEFRTADTEYVAFDPKANYRLEPHQLFYIEIPLPPKILRVAGNDRLAPDFQINARPFPVVASIFAVESAEGVLNQVLFQQFRSPQFLDRRFTICWNQNRFTQIENDGLSLATELAAIWQAGRLYFRSFAAASRFFDLEEFKPDATEEELVSFIGNQLFAFEGGVTDTVWQMISNDSFLRRRIAAIQAGNILASVRPRAAKNLAAEFEIEFEVARCEKKNRIVLPNNKKKLKVIVKFLAEEYFRGLLTNQHYETNSLRRVKDAAGG